MSVDTRTPRTPHGGDAAAPGLRRRAGAEHRSRCRAILRRSSSTTRASACSSPRPAPVSSALPGPGAQSAPGSTARRAGAAGAGPPVVWSGRTEPERHRRRTDCCRPSVRRTPPSAPEAARSARAPRPPRRCCRGSTSTTVAPTVVGAARPAADPDDGRPPPACGAAARTGYDAGALRRRPYRTGGPELDDARFDGRARPAPGPRRRPVRHAYYPGPPDEPRRGAAPAARLPRLHLRLRRHGQALRPGLLRRRRARLDGQVAARRCTRGPSPSRCATSPSRTRSAPG